MDFLAIMLIIGTLGMFDSQYKEHKIFNCLGCLIGMAILGGIIFGLMYLGYYLWR